MFYLTSLVFVDCSDSNFIMIILNYEFTLYTSNSIAIEQQSWLDKICNLTLHKYNFSQSIYIKNLPV